MQVATAYKRIVARTPLLRCLINVRAPYFPCTTLRQRRACCKGFSSASSASVSMRTRPSALRSNAVTSATVAATSPPHAAHSVAVSGCSVVGAVLNCKPSKLSIVEPLRTLAHAGAGVSGGGGGGFGFGFVVDFTSSGVSAATSSISELVISATSLAPPPSLLRSAPSTANTGDVGWVIQWVITRP